MLFRKKNQQKTQEPMDLEAVMQKFDRESNIRIWSGWQKVAVTCLLAVFSLFCIYVTLFATWLEELRLTTFVAFIVCLAYIVYPARKGKQKVNFMPWYDVLLMIIGTGAFLYFAFNAQTIIQQGSRFQWYQIVIGILGIISTAEACRRSVGLPIVMWQGALFYMLLYGDFQILLCGERQSTLYTIFFTEKKEFCLHL